jgi:copper chaperone NosL
MSCTPLRLFACSLVLIAVLAGLATAADPRPPGPEDRCPVCGMFVEKYRNWTATIMFEDGSQVFFDGPKDLFKFLLDPARYGHEKSLISDVFVTDYYTTKLVDARETVFVVGSDVMGPMGPELVPIASVEHAESFRADHGGEQVLSFDRVTADAIPK